MASFLEDIEPFRGTGAVNRQGYDLEKFLEKYDPGRYETPSNTVDTLVFSYRNTMTEAVTGLKLLMIKRGDHPSIGYWALPGGFVNMRENLEDAAKRELEEETGVKDLAVEQVRTWGDVNRDPRTRVITTAYMAVVKEDDVKVQAGDDAADASWCSLNSKKISENQSENKGIHELKREYVLTLDNIQKNLYLSARVEECRKRQGYIEETAYRVKETKGIACDHGAVITQAVLALEKRLKKG